MIEYYSKNVYGEERLYILNPGPAATITKLTGKKTVSKSDLNCLRALGLESVEVLPKKKA